MSIISNSSFIYLFLEQLYGNLMALSSAGIEQSTSKVFSYISTNVEDKASRADTIARLEIVLSRLDIALEKTGRIPITYVSLLRSRKVLERGYIYGGDRTAQQAQAAE